MAYDYKGQVIRRGNGNKRATLALQQMLQDAGYSPGKIDGSFGPKTEEALRKFQLNNGLDPDMIAGKETWAQLERARPQPESNPRRNLAREDVPEPMDGARIESADIRGEMAPADISRPVIPVGGVAQGPPEVTATDPQAPYTRSIDLGGVPDAGRMLRSPFGDPPVQAMTPGMGPGPESSSAPPEATNPEVPPDVAAMPTNGGFDPSAPLSALRARQFIAEALAQRNAPPGQRGPSPFDALGGKMPMGIGEGAFNQPGAPVPSPNGMPPWLMDLYK